MAMIRIAVNGQGLRPIVRDDAADVFFDLFPVLIADQILAPINCKNNLY